MRPPTVLHITSHREEFDINSLFYIFHLAYLSCLHGSARVSRYVLLPKVAQLFRSYSRPLFIVRGRLVAPDGAVMSSRVELIFALIMCIEERCKIRGKNCQSI